MDPKISVYFNDGMGVESFATVLRWSREPESRYYMIGERKYHFDWDQVTAITSQTGGEDRLTKYLNEEFKLPIYRDLNVRYVQIARAGPHEKDGIVILSDSRQEEHIYIEGAYKLSDELLVSGVVPAYGGGTHICSQKSKRFVAETFINFDLHEHKVCWRDPEEPDLCSACARKLREELSPKPAKKSRPKKSKLDRFDLLELFPEDATPEEPLIQQPTPDNITPILRVFGYNRDEAGRIAESDKAFQEFNAKVCGLVLNYNASEGRRIRESDSIIDDYNRKLFGLVFNFNSTESTRLREAKRYDVAPRIGIYPLELWGWSRQDALDYIAKHLGITWVRSRCSFCPFNRLTEDDLERHKNFPEELAEALFIEFVALAFNFRSTLYRNRSLYEIAVEHDMKLGLQLFDRKIEDCRWSLYRVRRIYHPKDGDPTKKGKTDRAVERLETGTRAEMAGEFTRRARGLMVERHHNHLYAYVRHRSELLFPTGEEFYVISPATVETKAAYSMDRFNNRWNLLITPGAAQGSAGQAALHY